ncbi:MAG TPA: hypothetical protein VHG27_03340 [Xanthobacteraceae bacterium]|nr:hypothetical protein [Xanthobacteraceae bacterium]
MQLAPVESSWRRPRRLSCDRASSFAIVDMLGLAALGAASEARFVARRGGTAASGEGIAVSGGARFVATVAKIGAPSADRSGAWNAVSSVAAEICGLSVAKCASSSARLDVPIA